MPEDFGYPEELESQRWFEEGLEEQAQMEEQAKLEQAMLEEAMQK